MEKILAGDTNDLNRGPILSINANFIKMVKKTSRLNHKNPKQSKILYNISTDMHIWYQKPNV